MTDVETINDLAEQAVRLCYEQGYAEASVKSKNKVFKAIVRLHESSGTDIYSEELLTKYIEDQTRKYENGLLKRYSYTFLIKTAMQMKELHDTGTIIYGRMQRETGMTEYYSGIISRMLSFAEWDKSYSYNIRRYAMPFFKWLVSEQINSIELVDESVIRKYLMYSAKRLKLNSVHHINYGLKKLFYFLYESGLTESNFSHVFAFQLPKENKVRKPVSHDEIADILNAVDRSTAMGKRDYAIILIGVVTGLRSSDIRELKFRNIDWINGEIRISQTKTGKALALPLTKDVGEAISDYILNGRPDIDCEHIFLKMFAPYTSLSESCIYNIINRYRFRLGLPRCGFHDLRRSLGTSLVVAGTPVTTVAQVLGHRNLESTKQYISLDMEHLGDICLDIEGMMPKEGLR